MTSLIKDLEFVRLRVPRAIPVELIENVKGRTFTVERFYKYQESQKNNPNNYLYALIDKVSKIEGFLWAQVNTLDDSLYVDTFSINKRLWGKGEAIAKVCEFLVELQTKTKAPLVHWCTTNAKFFLKHGFKKSKQCLMEYRGQ